MGTRARRIATLSVGIVLTAALAEFPGVALARQSTTLRPVRYHGYEVRVPRSWPVYNVARDPRVCVRFNRHALYLGAPGSDQRCPANAAGRTEAILLEPAASAARAGLMEHTPGNTSFVTRGVAVTATWSRHRDTVARALGRRSLPAPVARVARAPRAGPVAHAAAAVYTGLGFDACAAPSPQAMAAWGASPYRAIGIYIGGANAACAQPNLTPEWVSSEVAAGWHPIPTYVGLQAPSNSCGCAAINPSQAAAEGVAAASDAVANAQILDIPAGNPIYFDMEAYPHTASNTSAVLTFLSAWTTELHALGYVSGVYGSTTSGISDLAGAAPSGFAEPDDIWFAEWNGLQTTATAYLPATDWSDHQRLHQYQGGHNETYDGVTINIDNDYLDGATAGSGGALAPAVAPPPPPPPSLAIDPAANGTTTLSMTWAGAGAASWQVWAGLSPQALTPITSTRVRGVKTLLSMHDAAPYYAAAPVAATGQALAAPAVLAAPAHMAIFGASAFVPAGRSLVGLPVGCYTNAVCHVTTTVSVGRTVLARTRPERLGTDRTGLLYFKLSPRGRRMLARARGRQLPVQASVTDASGTTGTATVKLISFSTRGRRPRHSSKPASPLRIVGMTDFVSPRGVGGILAGCSAVKPCSAATTITVGRTVIARAGAERLGGKELGYLIFSLTPAGRRLLARARGNQLGAHVAITNGTARATAQISLVGFG